MRRMATTKQLDFLNVLSQYLYEEEDVLCTNGPVDFEDDVYHNGDSYYNGDMYVDGDAYFRGEVALTGQISVGEDGAQVLAEGSVLINANTADGESSITLEEGNLSLYADNNIILTSGLPTSDPGIEGALWNDNGVLKISAGE